MGSRRAVAAPHRRRLVALAVMAVAATGVASFWSAPARAAKAPAKVGFATPMVMDPIQAVGEPTIVHSPANDNTVYASGPWGTGTQRSIWDASADGGETFRLVQQCPPQSGQVSAVCPPPTAVQGTPNPPGGGDTDQRLDHRGKDYFADLYALACDRVATTTDHGATALQNAYGCNSPSATPSSRPDGSDRQWLSVFDPALTGVTSTAIDAPSAPLTYMEYNNLNIVANNCSYWVKSTDGINYSPANSDNGNFGCDGYPAVDQVTGKVFEASDGGNNNLLLNIGTPVDAHGDLCFLDDSGTVTMGGTAVTCPAGSGLITVATGLKGSPALLFTVASMDTGRNLHITYAVAGSVSGTQSTYQVFTTVASAATAWTKWATPVQVSQAPSNVNVFPWMVAGGPGRSDSVWYGTSSFIDPSTNAGQSWNVYMAQAVWPVDTTGAVTLAPASLTMVKVTPHPMHYNGICLLGTGCITAQGDRNLADFFTVTLDHAGAAQVEYDDTSNGLIQPAFQPSNGLADHSGAPLVTIAQQNSGPGLFGTAVTGLANEPSSAPTSGMSDRSGDALYPVIGGANVAGLDLTGNHLSLSSNNAALTATMKVVDVSSSGLAAAFKSVPGAAFLQYVTRWQMGNTIYYAMMETTPALAAAGQYKFYAGAAQSIDLCSVSACDPHVIFYPEAPATGGNSETGTVSCPLQPSPSSPCTVTIHVTAAHVGSPTQASLLEEVGSYSFGSAHLQAAVTNSMAELDQLPLEVDGICCFNFSGSTSR